MSISYHTLPKVELHRHLEGSMRWQTLLAMARANKVDAPFRNEADFRKHVQCSADDPRDLLSFLSKFRNDWYASIEDVYQVAHEAVEDAVRDRVIYLELRFSPAHYAAQTGFALDDVIRAVLSGAGDAAKGTDTDLRFIVTLSRNKQSLEKMTKILEIIAPFQDQGIVGVDLAGDEINFPPENFESIFKGLKDKRGLFSTIHAGEVTHAEQVRTAVERLEADRIGHGVRSVDDPKIQTMLMQRGIPLEICLTSNIQTGAVKKMEEHPLVELLKAGIPVTLNTDDPAISDITLSNEWRLAHEVLGLDMEDIQHMQTTAIQHAFLSERERRLLEERFMHLWHKAAHVHTDAD